MSSSNPMDASPTYELNSLNGRIQVSHGGATIGLLVERGALFGGTLLTPHQAHELAGMLLKCARLHEAVDIVTACPRRL